MARDKLRLALPPSRLGVGAGDTICLGEIADTWRVDRVEQGEHQMLEATRSNRTSTSPSTPPSACRARGASHRTLPVFPLLLDLPLLTGDEAPHAPRSRRVAPIRGRDRWRSMPHHRQRL